MKVVSVESHSINRKQLMRWRRVVVNHSGMSEAILQFNLHLTNPQEQTRHGLQEPDVENLNL